jgi:hypothetical protein
MRDRFKGEFDQFFGHVLSAYVGRILKTVVPYDRLLSEADLRSTYPAKFGKVPDWVIVDGRTAVLIECKAARIHRLTYVRGDEGELIKNVRDVMKGLQQLFEFRVAALRKAQGLDRLAQCDQFVPIVVTWEPLYLSRSLVFKDLLRQELSEPVRAMDWSILSLDELEWLQLYLGAGLDVAGVFRRTLSEDYNSIVESLYAMTKRTYRHSFLHEKENELTDRLGVPRLE